MARVAKIDNAIRKRFERQETKRKQDVRSKRRYYLIVCEGTKTEPYYFEGLKKELPPHVVELVDLAVKGTGRNPTGVINESIAIRNSIEQQPGRIIDEVWAVFDRDSFLPQDFNNAITKGSELGVHCAWTNEAFELWFLLHFQNFENAIPRTRYKPLLERELKKCLGHDYRYEKESSAMFNLLSQHGNLELAIKRAKQLEEQFTNRTDYANHNPCTKVHVLIEKLLYPKQ